MILDLFNSPKAFGEFWILLSPPPPDHSIFSPFLFYLHFPRSYFKVLFCALAPIDSTWPSLPKLGLAQFGFGDFPKPMHWSLLRICLKAP